MKKLLTSDIFILLLLPTFALAKATEFLLRPYGAEPTYLLFNQAHIVLIVVIFGSLGLFTYTSVLNILTTFTKMSRRLVKLIAYTLSLAIMVVGANLALSYCVALENSSITINGYTWMWPAVFNSAQYTVIILMRDFLIDMVVAVIISGLISIGLKSLLKRLRAK